jgi:hypothetical protein
VESIADRFADAEGGPIDVNGIQLWSMYRRKVRSGCKIKVGRRKATNHPVPGLRIKLTKGSLLVNGQVLKDVVLWSDTSPGEAEIECETPRKQEVELRVWNCWRDEQGIMQAWIGDYGIVVEEIGGGQVVLRCSCGGAGLTVDDLVVELVFTDVHAPRTDDTAG